ncbi:LTXXQ motif family protein [Halospina denitrificans]|uniref:LTXXQ motif family protein n=1 Tax=Halospina denitrificans TaxID=332522 RepID=A0A4R7K1Y7_9GAMM|nr:Spy/CpxP family protein refolding chaperone [Halospina denitrificans]TDT44037.1 LTXXQ motif family protein [Halospina denitrificans]
MKTVKLLAAALVALTMAFSVNAQQMGQSGGDQVDQLAKMIDLSDEQQEEIRGILDEMQGDIQETQQEIQELQKKLDGQIGPDYDEGAIREDAEKLGNLTGEMTAESILLQARVEEVFTEEQRKELEKKMRQRQKQMQQMQQQMQQRGGQGQGQGQGQQ